ncbi:hypothetical protein DJ92_4414 [Bacillus pseudomycoides]|nr:hypothetical protein DJ92_4414 [Bacillus pseudomycoides]
MFSMNLSTFDKLELFSKELQRYMSPDALEQLARERGVISVKPYDERAEADLYFEMYLKERGLFIGDEEHEIDKVVIRKKVEML